MNEISELIKNHRKKLKFSQSEVSQRIGIERSTYTRYETGHTEPNFKTFKEIIKVLEIPKEDVLKIFNLN